jgi:hypothetical protein
MDRADLTHLPHSTALCPPEARLRLANPETQCSCFSAQKIISRSLDTLIRYWPAIRGEITRMAFRGPKLISISRHCGLRELRPHEDFQLLIQQGSPRINSPDHSAPGGISHWAPTICPKQISFLFCEALSEVKAEFSVCAHLPKID